MKKFTSAFALSTILLGALLPTIRGISETQQGEPQTPQEIFSQTKESNNEKYDSTVPLLNNGSEEEVPYSEIDKKVDTESPEKLGNLTTTDDTDIASGVLGTAPWRIDSEGILHIETGDFTNTYQSPWKSYSTQINEIVFEGKVNGAPTSMSLFSGLSKVKVISNINLFNTSGITDMSFMFSDMSSLTSLDLSSFDTSNVKNMRSMFEGIKVSTLDLSSFDTSNVTNMYGMFNIASNLSTLDLSTFNTSNVTSMGMMFSNMFSLKNLNISSFDTSNVTNMFMMFAAATTLTELNVSSFDTANVTSMGAMFKSMYALEKLDLSSFDTTNVNNLRSMFDGVPLHSLALGNKTVLMNSAGDDVKLNNPIADSSYTGNWQTVGTGTELSPNGNWVGSSVELINRSSTNTPDTYVWEPIKLPAQDVIVEYIDEDGRKIPNVSSQTISGNIGDPYDATTEAYKLEISGYTLDESKLPANGKGTLSDKAQTVTYVYKQTQDQSTVIVHDSELTVGDTWKPEDNFDSATDYDGNAVPFSNITVDGSVDTSKVGTYKITYSRILPSFFSAENQGEYSAVATITVKDAQPAKGRDVTAKYIDTDGNKISDDAVKTGNVGETYTTEQKSIEGYIFKEVQGNTTGQFTDQAQTVTYVYTKNEIPNVTGTVLVKYVDTDGKKISEDLVKSGTVGEGYSTEKKDIKGYTFKEIQGSATGQFKDQPQTVTYVYAKNRANTVNPEPKPENKPGSKDKNNNQGITSSDQHSLPATGENERMTMMSIILGLILTALATVVSIFRFKKVNK